MSLTKGVLAVVFALLSAAGAQTRVAYEPTPADERGPRPAAAFDRATVAASFSARSLPIPTPTSCPVVDVSCPGVLKPGEPMTFTATISGGDPAVTPTFKWTVSGGTITSGQGTSSITVHSGDDSRRSVTATVDVGGYVRECDVSGSCTLSPGDPPVSRKIDEYGDITVGNEKARLDNFAIELQNDPTAQGYLICYGGRRASRVAARRRCERAKNFLVVSRGVDPARLVALEGGYVQSLTVELWIVPSGAQPPLPTPNGFPNESKPAPARRPAWRTSR
ncbi:MAG TPA: hypothetical protein VJ866_02175 [Pyrinomonadaceae bacterium]|nr:hypothetical protein [Pyrinomonadaceae bacterium]